MRVILDITPTKPMKPKWSQEDEFSREALREMYDQSQITQTEFSFPGEVVRAIEVYITKNAVDREGLMQRALKAQQGSIPRFAKAINRLVNDPESFCWPIDDPLLCLALAFMREVIDQWTNKDDLKYPPLYEAEFDRSDPADWWKMSF
jgi:hypothetical protein